MRGEEPLRAPFTVSGAELVDEGARVLELGASVTGVVLPFVGGAGVAADDGAISSFA